MKVLLVTSWGEKACGIQSHSEMLIDHVRQVDSDILFTPRAEALDPFANHWMATPPDLLVLNYHRALHSRWTPLVVQTWKAEKRIPVVIVFHDTYETPDDLTRSLCDLADAFVVHEPVPDLPKATYWRMGVLELNGMSAYRHAEWHCRPYLGTVGFGFGWKNWPKLAEITKEVGWGLRICTPEMSERDEAELRLRNPWLDVHRNEPTEMVLSLLHDCTATAFTNVCGNSGQSAAILLGIAARKPVIALETCRQYRSLFLDPLANQQIRWAKTFEEVQQHLINMSTEQFDTGIVALAEQESWRSLGAKYAALFRSLA